MSSTWGGAGGTAGLKGLVEHGAGGAPGIAGLKGLVQ